MTDNRTDPTPDTDSTSAHAPTRPHTPRHRGDDNSAAGHWWRPETTATRGHRRAKPENDSKNEASHPGEHGARHRQSVVGPWTMLAPGGPTAEWASEHAQEAAEDIPVPPYGWSGSSTDKPLTRVTDRSATDRTAPKPSAPTIATAEHIGDPREIATSRTTPDPAPSGAAAAATSFPAAVETEERGLTAFFRHTTILLGRQLRVVMRDRLTLIQSLLFPLLSMVMFKVVLGDAVGQATGQNSAFGTVPLVVLVGAMFGSLAVGTRLMSERATGLLTKLYVLPVHRGADLSSRVGVEMIRILVSTLILTTAGMTIGWRFNQGLLPALGIFGVALLYGAAYSTIVLTLSVSSSNVPLVPLMSLVTSLLMFFNSGFSPIEAYPEMLQPLVRNQPMTTAIETMRALATGGPVAENLTKTVVWALLVIAIFAYPALRGYRRAAASRT